MPRSQAFCIYKEETFRFQPGDDPNETRAFLLRGKGRSDMIEEKSERIEGCGETGSITFDGGAD